MPTVCRVLKVVHFTARSIRPSSIIVLVSGIAYTPRHFWGKSVFQNSSLVCP